MPEILKPRRIDVLGVPVDCLDMEGALALVDSTIRHDGRLTILAVNPEKVMAARRDPKILAALRGAGLLIPDGIGVVWAAGLLSKQRLARVPGSELMPAICAMAAQNGYGVFLFGAAPEVNETAARVLQSSCPGLRIVGRRHGFVAEAETAALLGEINRSGADVLFVALGSPRQELWINQHIDELNVKVYQGVGGTFDILAGRVRRAPKLFRDLHLEWFYRLLADPRRLARQAVIPVFAVRVLWQKLTHSL
jgi:N-acetylglucosaminyldiphosphoundecaprenol N-acetyl-beta-D-mannosaminyltransferase